MLKEDLTGVGSIMVLVSTSSPHHDNKKRPLDCKLPQLRTTDVEDRWHNIMDRSL